MSASHSSWRAGRLSTSSTGGIEEALRLAKEAAGDKDVKIGGGVSTVRQYLKAGLIDSLHLAVAPVVLGQGEALFAGLDMPALGFRVTDHKGYRVRKPHCAGSRLGGGFSGGETRHWIPLILYQNACAQNIESRRCPDFPRE